MQENDIAVQYSSTLRHLNLFEQATFHPQQLTNFRTLSGATARSFSLIR